MKFYTLYQLLENKSMYDIFEMEDEILFKIWNNFIHNKKKPQKWNLISANLLIKTWNDYVKYGIVRNDKAIDKMENIILHNIVQLHINSQLTGHAQIDPIRLLNDFYYGEDDELSDDELETLLDKFSKTIIDKNGQWKISDYALKPLYELAEKLYTKDKTSEDKLQTIDRILNVVHQRGDIASLFVEGGIKTLNKLSEK